MVRFGAHLYAAAAWGDLMQIYVSGEPQAKARHRQTKFGTYNPQSELEAAIRYEIQTQLGKDFVPYACPLHVQIKAFFTRPKKHFGTGKNSGLLKPSAPEFHSQKPDCDNIAKLYKDCMNDLVYTDDKLVTRLTVWKHWSTNSTGMITPGIYITVTPLE